MHILFQLYVFASNFLKENLFYIIIIIKCKWITTLNNRTTDISSLNVSGFTTLNNDTNVNAPLYVSGVNILEALNNQSTNFIYNGACPKSVLVCALNEAWLLFTPLNLLPSCESVSMGFVLLPPFTALTPIHPSLYTPAPRAPWSILP